MKYKFFLIFIFVIYSNNVKAEEKIINQNIISYLNIDEIIKLSIENNNFIKMNNQNILINESILEQSKNIKNPFLGINHEKDYFNKTSENIFEIRYSQPFEFFGKRDSIINLYKIELELSKYQVEQQKKNFILDIKTFYINLISDMEYLQVLEKELEFSKKNMEISKKRNNLGDNSKYDLNSTLIGSNKIKTKLIETKNSLKNSQLKLNLYSNKEVNVKSDFFYYDSKKLDQNYLYSKALENRFDIKRIKLKSIFYENKIKKLNFDNIPNTNITTSLILGSETSSNSKIISLGISSEIPIFDRNQGNILEIKNILIQNELDYDLKISELKNDLKSKINDIKNLEEIINSYKLEIIPLLEENVLITKKAYDLGEQDLINYIFEQRNLLTSKKEYIEYIKQYNLKLIELEKITGLDNIAIINNHIGGKI
ncbi:MAG: TolC family protein [Cyanobacteriota bacterium]